MAEAKKAVDPLLEIANALRLLLKLKIEEVKEGRTQKEMIHFLDSLGVSSGDIADLLAVSRTTVAPELSKLHAAKKPTKSVARKPRR